MLLALSGGWAFKFLPIHGFSIDVLGYIQPRDYVTCSADKAHAKLVPEAHNGTPHLP